MYPYFALKVVGWRIPRRIANCITTLQLAQMIIGFAVNILSVYWLSKLMKQVKIKMLSISNEIVITNWNLFNVLEIGYDCARDPFTIKFFAGVYGSFIILFGKLFYESVIKAGRQKKEKAKAELLAKKNNNNNNKEDTKPERMILRSKNNNSQLQKKLE